MPNRYSARVLAAAVISILAFTLLLAHVQAQAPSQFPIMDKVADKIVAKYQSSSCEQLWEKKSQKAPPSPEEQRAVMLLKSDPQMRTAFINRIAAPIANKMFDCGLIP
ncbi:MAG TPA: hypothetical protein VKR57_10760 [Terriglobales bacterium]|nr:hypothetical protein [Terriglobales bacterium]